jgi:predicted alpha-1,6-mannanase (GH76 family)
MFKWKSKRIKFTAIILLAAIAFTLLPLSAASGASNKYDVIGSAIAAELAGWYNEQTGLWDSTGWWNSANVLESIIDYSRNARSEQYLPFISNTFEKHQAGNFLNHFYDDEGWWALAWIKAYDLTKETRYLDMAKTIFADMTTGWDQTCGGGVWWNKDRRYKNAITNELFLTVAAKLHQRTPGDAGPGSYLDWAERSWQWFEGSGMMNEDHLINDGLNAACENNGDVTWTYNQGVVLGGLIELYRIKGDREYLQTAQSIADAAIRTLVNEDGILREPCEQNGCGADGPSFKGIFMRYLNMLYDETKEIRYRKFVERNVDALWANRTSTNLIGVKWDRPADVIGAAPQHSALDAVNGLVQKEPKGSNALPNVARHKNAVGSAACSPAETPEKAVDGSAKSNSRFCSNDAAPWLMIDLGSVHSVSKFVLKHVVTADGKPALNQYSIQISQDGNQWRTVKTVTGNASATAHHAILQTPARYVKLLMSPPAEGPAAIYELEVYGVFNANGPNLALNKTVTGTTACAPSEGPEKLTDGSFMNNSKFCTFPADKWAQIDLGEEHVIAKIIVKHAGHGGENPNWNTDTFAFLVSQDGNTWTEVFRTTGNTGAESIHSFAPVTARFVKMNIFNAGSDNVARIYEVEVYGAAR